MLSLALGDVVNEVWNILVACSWTSKYCSHFSTLKKGKFGQMSYFVAIRKKEPNISSPTQALGEA